MTTLETEVTEPKKKIDPVCGMEVEPGSTNMVSVYKGQRYWFCAEGCRKAFEADPNKYLEQKPRKKKGWFGRYLDRMAEVNKKEFGCYGCCGPKCH